MCSCWTDRLQSALMAIRGCFNEPGHNPIKTRIALSSISCLSRCRRALLLLLLMELVHVSLAHASPPQEFQICETNPI